MTTLFEEKFIVRRPLASDNLRDGLYRMSPEDALQKRFIQASLSTYRNILTFDVDDSDSMRSIKSAAYDDERIPEPNYVTVNSLSGHAHVGYILNSPVGSPKGLQWASDITDRLTSVLGADRGYRMVTTRNPLHPSHFTEWMREEPYELKELSDTLPKLTKSMSVKVDNETESGRNEMIFNRLRKHAYQIFRKLGRDEGLLYKELERTALELLYGMTDTSDFNLSELMSIVRSVTKWTAKNLTSEGFSQLQAARAQKRWGDNAEKKEIIKIMKELGHTWKEIADEVGSTQSAVRKMYSRNAGN